MTLQVQIIILASVMLFSFTAGWEVNKWKMNSAQLAVVSKMEQDFKATQAKTAKDAADLNAANAKLKADARTSTVTLRTDIAKNPSLAKCMLGASIVRDYNNVP